MLADRVEDRGSPIDPAEYLFQSRYGNPINRDKLRQNVIRPALVKAGLPETIRTYDLRQSHASLLDLGANVLAVSQRMGHSDSAVTLREYGHLFEGTQAKLTEQLDALVQATEAAPTSAEIVDLTERRSGTL
jgi:integrase